VKASTSPNTANAPSTKSDQLRPFPGRNQALPPNFHPRPKTGGFLLDNCAYIQSMEQWPDEEFEDGAGERVSLDTPSKFTLTRFRHSKYTKFFLWFISILGLGWGT
jgi:hypothetical protein